MPAGLLAPPRPRFSAKGERNTSFTAPPPPPVDTFASFDLAAEDFAPSFSALLVSSLSLSVPVELVVVVVVVVSSLLENEKQIEKFSQIIFSVERSVAYLEKKLSPGLRGMTTCCGRVDPSFAPSNEHTEQARK